MNLQTAFLFHTEEIFYTPVSDKLIDLKESEKHVHKIVFVLFLFF